MDSGQSYGIQWVPQGDIKSTGHLIIGSQSSEDDVLGSNCVGRHVQQSSHGYLVHEMPSEEDIDQIAAENLIFMARDGQMMAEMIGDGVCSDVNETTEHHVVDNDDSGIVQFNEDYSEAQMVTEEVITDDWVQHQGEERVEIPVEQICGSNSNILLDIEVPLPTVQDEYTALRPYPCDFCSRRFRKKVSLMNHMVAHQNDRPHVCKLCGSRFFRRSDLINHLKAHAEASEPEYDDTDFMNFSDAQHKQSSTHHSIDHYYDHDWTKTTTRTHSATLKPRRTHQITNNHSSTSSSSNQNNNNNHHLHGHHHSRRANRIKPKEENYTIDETLRQQQGYQQQQQFEIQQQQLEYKQQQHSEERVFASPTIEREVETITPEEQFPVVDENKPFVCQQCGLAFSREKAMQSHLKTHRNDSPFECNTCNEIFWDLASLQEHQKTHQFEASNSEYEPADDSQSDSESELLYGGNSESEHYYCHKCGMSFHRKNLLKRHAKQHIKEEEVDNKDQHCCSTCGETFSEALDLLAHAEFHARYPPFKCVLCGESFFDEAAIKHHLNNVHGSEMATNSCILCGKECRDRKALIKHAWDHSREKCHSCSKCGKNFHNKARLKRHMASHRDKSVNCDVCHEEFPDGRSLSNHRHSHSATSSGKLFPCHECGKTFGSRSSQQIHVRIHTGERPYGCRFCWKAFADGGTLRKHERIHTGEKPYGCSVCPRAFNQRVVLREHIRSHHSAIDKKRGTYYCSVCSAVLSNSTELIQHLIQHSDMNTAKQRQPITGPRKYKRRRKLKPHEIERLRSEKKITGGSSDIDISDFDMNNVDDLLGKAEGGSPTTSSPPPPAKPVKSKKQSSTASAETSTKKRYNSTGGSSTEKLSSTNWQPKFMNSSNDDTYKSLLSNLENTLQSIDTLVVSNPGSYLTAPEVITSDVPPITFTGSTSMTTKQSTNQAVISTTTTTNPRRLKAQKPSSSSSGKTSGSRPRMIHTEKTRVAADFGKRRSKTLVARSERHTMMKMHVPTQMTAQITTAKPPTLSNLEDDYEIISPNSYPPNQISSSPLHIKQEPLTTSIVGSCSSSSRSDLYDAQLLLEATALRKDYDKYNPAIVNDLEEILRSPDKSTTTTTITPKSSACERLLIDDQIIKDETSLIPQSLDYVRRSTRSRRPVSNRRYLEFDTEVTPAVSSSCRGSNSNKTKIDATNRGHSARVNAVATIRSTTLPVQQSAPPQQLVASPSAPPQRKQQYFECEMCSAVFPDRAQLLDHVPIHI